jgi:uncharacterized membrane protein YgcG
MKLTDEQLSEALSVSEEHPVLKAMGQILDDTLRDEVHNAIIPSLSAEDRAYNSGRAAAIKDLIAQISALRNERELTSGQF